MRLAHVCAQSQILSYELLPRRSIVAKSVSDGPLLVLTIQTTFQTALHNFFLVEASEVRARLAIRAQASRQRDDTEGSTLGHVVCLRVSS